MNITDGKVIGDTISFVAGDTRYTGRVNGNAIEGISQTSTGWRATRGIDATIGGGARQPSQRSRRRRTHRPAPATAQHDAARRCIDRFFMAWIIWFARARRPAGRFQKSWKKNAATAVNRIRPTAASRVCHPTAIAQSADQLADAGADRQQLGKRQPLARDIGRGSGKIDELSETRKK